jgi:hypothetical protein
MRLLPFFRRRSSKNLSISLLLLLLGFGLEAADVEAQSGRRGSKLTPTGNVAPAPTPQPETTKEPAPGKLPTKVQLLVARQPTSKHFYSEDQILASFIKQLNRYENIEAISIGDFKESDAVDRAKAERDAYVIVMKFDVDNFKGGTIILNSQDLEVEYDVLAPVTGKKQTKGKVYFQGMSGGMIRKSDWPNGTPIRMTTEAAGIEAADGLYFWLKLVTAEKKAQ